MASRFISPHARPVRHQRAPWRRPDPRPHPVAISTLLASLPSLPRPILSRLTLRMIERLDELDGDPDVEANGDEEDGIPSEDEFMDHGGYLGIWSSAGSPISDPDYGVDDVGEDDRAGI